MGQLCRLSVSLDFSMINQITSGHVKRKNHITPDIVTLQTINVVQSIEYSTQIKPQAFFQSTYLFAVRAFLFHGMIYRIITTKKWPFFVAIAAALTSGFCVS